MMKMSEIRQIAREKGLTPGKEDKVGLIRMIQHQEGNFDCFATAYDGVCDQTQCSWRGDCFEAARRTAEAFRPARPEREPLVEYA
jgi:hypothetical protein